MCMYLCLIKSRQCPSKNHIDRTIRQIKLFPLSCALNVHVCVYMYVLVCIGTCTCMHTHTYLLEPPKVHWPIIMPSVLRGDINETAWRENAVIVGKNHRNSRNDVNREWCRVIAVHWYYTKLVPTILLKHI